MAERVQDLLLRAAAAVDAELDHALPKAKDEPMRVHEAMRYSVFSGGKRLRPAIALAVGEALGLATNISVACGAAIELIHAFSLVHDDLPAMDDDDLRRGRPTNHKVYGEAVAILAGDALSVLAFEVLAQRLPAGPGLGAAVLELARASGTFGMIGGQILDLEAEGKSPTVPLVDRIHLMKTAALLRASATLPALAGGASQEAVDAMRAYGTALGLSFQIVDDVLDETSTPEELGKGTGKDRDRGKMTYPVAVGVEASLARAKTLAHEAALVAAPFDRTGALSALADFVVERRS